MLPFPHFVRRFIKVILWQEQIQEVNLEQFTRDLSTKELFLLHDIVNMRSERHVTNRSSLPHLQNQI